MRNSIGETITIKRATINRNEWSTESAKILLSAKEETNFRQVAQINYRRCIKVESDSSCKKAWLGRDYEAMALEVKDLKDFIAKKLVINYVEFIPVFTDLNNNSMSTGKASLACPLPNASADEEALANRISRLADFPVELRVPGFDLRPVERRLCSANP